MNIAFLYMDPKGAPAMGAGYAYLSIPKGHKADFYCMMRPDSDKKYKELPKMVAAGKYDMIMISTTTLLYTNTLKLMKNIKRVSNVPILMGGVHPTVAGVDLLKENTNIDYACMGEGEIFIKEFLDNYGKESLFDINNLMYRKDGEVKINELNRPYNLDKLPVFPYNLFNRIMNNKKFLHIEATRGCPYSCTYCCNSNFLKMYGKDYMRYRPIGQVIDELKSLNYKYRLKRFSFLDEMIFFNSDYASELFKALKKHVNRSYACCARVEHIDDKIVKVLRETGCKSVSMGVECGDEQFRKEHLNRFMTNDQIINAFRLLKRANIGTISFNIIGWPFSGDDLRTRITADFNKKLAPNFVQVTWFYPFPGTKLYDYCVKNDLIDKSKIITGYHKGSVLKMYEGKRSYFRSYGEVS